MSKIKALQEIFLLQKKWTQFCQPMKYHFQKSKLLQLDRLEVKLWRSFHGHGGNVICVKFSPTVGEFICSTATDRQARLWSIYSTDCLFVLDHDSIVTSCAFNSDCSMLATGCLDKTLSIWKLPQQMVSANICQIKVIPVLVQGWRPHQIANRTPFGTGINHSPGITFSVTLFRYFFTDFSINLTYDASNSILQLSGWFQIAGIYLRFKIYP